jgi:hypothetical protein
MPCLDYNNGSNTLTCMNITHKIHVLERAHRDSGFFHIFAWCYMGIVALETHIAEFKRTVRTSLSNTAPRRARCADKMYFRAEKAPSTLT